MYRRLCKPSLSKSFFLFGARHTGKSTLVQGLLPVAETLKIDLLDQALLNRFLAYPQEFEALILSQVSSKKWIYVDEIQRAPQLLNYVHKLIEETHLKFALTGSSARKLKRGGANLLAGRALLNHLYPLTHTELAEDFNLTAALHWGSLPPAINEKDKLLKNEILKTYVQVYIKEEIKEEQLVRKLDPFIRFLEVSAQCNGKILNYSKIARDCHTDPQMIERYFEILTDTMIGYYLDPFHESVRKRQSKKPKFFYFDLGVKRALEGTLTVDLIPSTSAFGEAFEHFFILECFRLNDYFKKDFKFSYIRTKDDVEIDLVIERPGKTKILIEIKSANDTSAMGFKNQSSLANSIQNSEFWIISQDPKEMKYKDYRTVYWKNALQELFG